MLIQTAKILFESKLIVSSDQKMTKFVYDTMFKNFGNDVDAFTKFNDFWHI